MTHSHSQIMALPVITRNKNDELQGAQEYYDTNKKCIFCDVVHHETKVNSARLIDENKHFISIAPYAPMYSYETWLLPKRHSSNFETTDDEEVNQSKELSAHISIVFFYKVNGTFGHRELVPCI
jgi:UDPglucose--hexose-1-phosphate uridylyltransferase